MPKHTALAGLLSNNDVLSVVVKHIVSEEEDNAHARCREVLAIPQYFYCPFDEILVPNVALHAKMLNVRNKCTRGASQLAIVSNGSRHLRSALASRIGALAKVYISTHQCNACECRCIQTTQEVMAKCMRCGESCICTRCSEEMMRDTAMETYPACCYSNESIVDLFSDMPSEGMRGPQ